MSDEAKPPEDHKVIMPIPVELATKAMATLRGAPMLFVLVLLNAAILALVFYMFSEISEFRSKQQSEMLRALENCYMKKSQGPNDTVGMHQ